MRNTQDNILLALLSYINAIAVSVFINSNSKSVASVTLLNTFILVKTVQVIVLGSALKQTKVVLQTLLNL